MAARYAGTLSGPVPASGSPPVRPYSARQGVGCPAHHSSRGRDPASTIQASAGFFAISLAMRLTSCRSSIWDLSEKKTVWPAASSECMISVKTAEVWESSVRRAS